MYVHAQHLLTQRPFLTVQVNSSELGFQRAERPLFSPGYIRVTFQSKGKVQYYQEGPISRHQE